MNFLLNTENIFIDATIISWDTEIFNSPVCQINIIKIINEKEATTDYLNFKIWLDDKKITIVSCRMHHESFNESFFLEKMGFKFIEMVLHPNIDLLNSRVFIKEDIIISRPEEEDLDELERIAASAFKYERYHVDPRIDSRYGNLRYMRWIRNSFKSEKQILLKICDEKLLVGFFIIEIFQNNSAYWHLTAINPLYQGIGYGKRVWEAILYWHQQNGCTKISTTISARNIEVLNLYSKLNFRFSPPEMTFHFLNNIDKVQYKH
jgi:RimJ/RimL family protein N-acetyltransferase